MIWRKKLLNFLLVMAFHLGYLEWGKDQHSFIFQAEAEIFSKARDGMGSIMHPFIILPFIGILILFFTLFQRNPSRLWTLIGLSTLGLLMLFLFLIGITGPNFKTLLSTIPFWIVASIIIFRSPG